MMRRMIERQCIQLTEMWRKNPHEIYKIILFLSLFILILILSRSSKIAVRPHVILISNYTVSSHWWELIFSVLCPLTRTKISILVRPAEEGRVIEYLRGDTHGH